jgi:hypothetical protein
VRRAKYGAGEKWMIRDKLKDNYICQGNVDDKSDEKKENCEEVF